MTTGKEITQPTGSEQIQHMSELPAVKPPVDIYENEEEILLLADFPGVDPAQVEVRLEAGQLDLEGKQVPPQEQAESLPAVLFARSFRVPDTIDPGSVTAELKAGVLTVHLRKSEQAKPKRIRVSAG
jgi:HSP20 family molecular chaperone IbpA